MVTQLRGDSEVRRDPVQEQKGTRFHHKRERRGVNKRSAGGIGKLLRWVRVIGPRFEVTEAARWNGQTNRAWAAGFVGCATEVRCMWWYVLSPCKGRNAQIVNTRPRDEMHDWRKLRRFLANPPLPGLRKIKPRIPTCTGCTGGTHAITGTYLW